MLILGSRLISTPIMGLQTGTKLAETKNPVIDPGNLKIIAYEVSGKLLSDNPSFIRIADIRELSDVGFIIDSNDEFIGLDDVINLKKIYELNFNLINHSVIDEIGRKLGKVCDYSLETDTFLIQQLNIKRNIIKSFNETNLLIHRTQIVEINDKDIVVKSNTKKLHSIQHPSQLSYINPFRSTVPQVENLEL
ncbi:MAG TPA: PRC-barrel domain-containing protein [Candidatus Saccharibacteria bacterium]|nr:PRC-barrel domain-containing protein [Candidatus Saccharibacteria bacterium]